MRVLMGPTLAVAITLGGSAGAEPITFDDLYGMPRLDDPQISPDGQRIAFVLEEPDPVAGTSIGHLWLMSADGSAQRQVTHGEAGESRPRWLPDGSGLAFVAKRGEASQVWLLPLEGGEAQALSSLAAGASGVECSPDGKSFLFVSKSFPDCPDDACNRERLARREADLLQARSFEHLLYRHYNAWEDGRVQQLFVGDLAGGSRNLHPSAFDIPTTLLGSHRDYAFAPDGDEVCFAASTDDHPAVWVNNDLYVVPTAGGDARRLTTSRGLDTAPLYSPDGRYLSYLATARAGYESDQRDLVLRQRASGALTNLTRDFDRSVGEVVWSPDSRQIYFTAIDHGFTNVYRIDVGTNAIATLLEGAVHRKLRVSPDGRFLVLARSLAHEPYELYRYDLGAGELRRLTRFSAERVAKLDLVPAEDFWFEGHGGDRVHGFLTLPPGFDPERKYPLVLLIHGGPQWCWLGDFNYYGWNTQLMAAQGYVVAQIDPHGSVGYGLEFKEYVSGNWGRGDYEDLMAGVDHLLATRPFIDATRMAALGRSYGGFMTNWIAGHSDRFRCLVTVDGTYEHAAKYGSTEELWFPEWEFQGTPWTNPDEYRRSSPATYAASIKTPMLIAHGQLDYRVDLSQGLMLFTALRRQGVPAELLYFPDEGHGIKKIRNHRFVYERQLAWLARWLR